MTVQQSRIASRALKHRSWALLCALCLALSSTLRAEEPAAKIPVGFVLDCNFDEESLANAQNNVANCTRGGTTLDAEEGQPVFAGDVVATGEKSQIAVAFVDGSVVTLRESSKLTVTDYAYPLKRTPTHLQLDGTAFFSITERPADAHFFVKTNLGDVEVKGTKFQIFTTFIDGKFSTTVAVTQGRVSLSSKTSRDLEIKEGTKVIASLTTTNIEFGDINVVQGGMTKRDLMDLQKNAIVSASFSTGKKNSLKITSTIHNPDGTTLTSKVTEIDGVRIAAVYTIKDDATKKSVFTYSESGRGVSVNRTFGQYNIRGGAKGLVGTDRNGAGTFTDPTTKRTFTGTFTIDKKGNITFQGTSKDGSRVFYEQARDFGGIKTERVIITDGAGNLGHLFEVITNPDGSKTTTTADVTVDPDGHYTIIPGTDHSNAAPPTGIAPPTITTPGGEINPLPISGG